jgi:hypothetical protein
MRPTLPRTFLQKLRDFGFFLIAIAGCHHADPPVAPGPPLRAEPDAIVGSMDDECAGLKQAIATWAECPNLDDDERSWAHDISEYAEESFAAGRKGNPDPESQRAIAIACHRAAVSIGYATQRCNAGPKPRVD